MGEPTFECNYPYRQHLFIPFGVRIQGPLLRSHYQISAVFAGNILFIFIGYVFLSLWI